MGYVTVIIAGVVGMLAGALVGYYGKCQSSACALMGSPLRGALFGAVLGAALAAAAGCRKASGPGGPSGGASKPLTPVATAEAFDRQVLQAAQPVLVDFFATWCGPCKQLAPTLERLAADYEGRAGFVKVDVDQSPDLAQQYDIQGYPTVLLFRGGQEIERWLGGRDEGVYRKALEAAIGRAGAAPVGAPKETAMTERTGQVSFKGKPLTLIGPKIEICQAAPDFTAVGNDLSEVKLSDFRGKTVVLAVAPSLDTPVCDRQTRRFNEEAGKLGQDVVVLTISMDLPFAQARWCGAAGVKHVKTLSDHREATFGRAYGVLIKELRLLARSIFIVDASGRIRYVEIMPEMTKEPDYDKALEAIAEAGVT